MSKTDKQRMTEMRNLADKTQAAAKEQVGHMSRRVDEFRALLGSSEVKAGLLARKNSNLKKRLLATEVEIGRLRGYLERVREGDADDRAPVHDQTTRVTKRGTPESDVRIRGVDMGGAAVSSRGIDDSHWLDD